MKKIFIILLACLLGQAQAQSILSGRVVSATDSTALPGAVIKVKGMNTGVTANELGNFRLGFEGSSAHIQISYIGFVSTELIALPGRELIVTLQPDANQLGEVVISTGYQNIPRERSTGSFSTVDNALLNRRVSPDLLSRLDDTMPGLITNKGRGAAQGLLIRGQSTINSATAPLIIIDNFPYEGDISTLNPNDVESVTILKDAAAASIWGSRAGNGVIVITTKKGLTDQTPQISFNSNLTLARKPDIYYQPRISSSDYIDNELMLFSNGRYASAERSASKLPFTPVVELLTAARDGLISHQQAEAQIAELKTRDVRRDYQRYLYQPAANQQYALSIRGGGQKNRYLISTGFDKGLSSLVGNSNQRLTLNINNT
jgi:TonB-dependent SusC/RagA subfamily outer membrane receptor